MMGSFEDCACGGHCQECDDCQKPECECTCYDFLDEEDLDTDWSPEDEDF
jgi:hypothetical protein